jgi:hypothetical protein
VTQTTTPGTAARPPGGPQGPHVDQPAPASSQPTSASAAGRRVRGRLRRAFEGTPGRLRAAAVIGVLVSLVFAALGANAFRTRGDALDEASNSAAQLVRVQQIATDLTQADAVVTNAFLEGAKESPGVVDQYQGFISDASKQLAAAAKAQPGDAAALAAVNDGLSKYTAAVATARANNRLGYQVGGAYLRQASNLLRTPTAQQPAMLPTLQSVARADAERVDDAFGAASNAAWQLLLAGVVVLGGLLGLQVWLARRTRRILNIPLTWGTGAVVVSLALGAFTLLSTQSRANDVRDTSYAATRALSQERIAAFDAKANESLTLVYQGTGQAYEDAYKKLWNTAVTEAGKAENAGVVDTGVTQLKTWNGIHQEIRGLDNAGNWTAAVQKATGTGPGTTSQPFNQLDSITGQALDAEASQVSEGLSSPHWLLVVLGWATLLLGLFGAATAWWGVSQRLGEYR